MAGGQHTVTLSVTDQSNNVAQCSATVTIADTSPPAIVACATNRYINTGTNQQALIPDLTGQVSVSNQCNAAVITQIPVAGTGGGPAPNAVTLTAPNRTQ